MMAGKEMLLGRGCLLGDMSGWGGVAVVCFGLLCSAGTCVSHHLPLLSAMQQVLDNLGSLPNATGAAELDLIFLRGIMESPIVRSLAKV